MDSLEERAKEILKLFTLIESDHNARGEEVLDSGEWYNITYKQSTLIKDQAARIEELERGLESIVDIKLHARDNLSAALTVVDMLQNFAKVKLERSNKND